VKPIVAIAATTSCPRFLFPNDVIMSGASTIGSLKVAGALRTFDRCPCGMSLLNTAEARKVPKLSRMIDPASGICVEIGMIPQSLTGPAIWFGFPYAKKTSEVVWRPFVGREVKIYADIGMNLRTVI